MLFFNSRIRNTRIATVPTRDRSNTHTLAHTFIITGCLLVISGLIVIVTGVMYDRKKTTLIGIAIISLGVGFFLITLIGFHAKLSIYYNNWAYGSQIIPINVENPPIPTAGVISMSPFTGSHAVSQKPQPTISLTPSTPLTVASDTGVGNIIIAPTIEIGKPTANTDNPT